MTVVLEHVPDLAIAMCWTISVYLSSLFCLFFSTRASSLIRQLAAQHGVAFVETSAMTGAGVEEAFLALVSASREYYELVTILWYC